MSAVVLAQDVERQIGACLRSLSWADEVVVLDGGSQDRTVAIAEAAGARVEHRPFDDFAHQRQVALDHATSDWVLFIDADERVSSGLAAEIRAALRSGTAAGYWFPRRNYIWGRWIRGGGWFPDEQLRLLRRDRTRYDLDGFVHEVALVDGDLATLRCAIVHYNYESVGQFVRKQRHYAALDARMQIARGERGRFRRLLTMPAREAWRRYVQLRGWRDGLHGAALAGLTAMAVADSQWRILRQRVDPAR